MQLQTQVIYNKQVGTLINTNHLNTSLLSNYGGYLNGGGIVYGTLLPPSISQKFGVTPTDSNHLRVFSTFIPTSNYGGFYLTPNYSSSNTAIKGYPLANIGAGYSIVNNRYFLAPYEIDFPNKIAKCNLVRVDTTFGIQYSIQFGSSKDISLIPPASTHGFEFGNYWSFSYFNKFFITLSDQFFRVDTMGNVKAFGVGPIANIGGRVIQIFTLNNYLLAIYTSGLTTSIILSSDFGETWSVFANNVDSYYGLFTFQNINADVYAYFQSQIWKVTLNGNNLNFVELDNDGLQTNQITGINKVGKNAFVTTTSGLFYRDTSSFNTPKK